MCWCDPQKRTPWCDNCHTVRPDLTPPSGAKTMSDVKPQCDNAGCLNSESGFGRKYCKTCWDKQNPDKCFYCKGTGSIFSSGQEVSDCSHCKEQRPEPLDMDAINEMYDQPNGGLYFP